MLVMVEGLANSGKTSLVKALADSGLAHTKKFVRTDNPVMDMAAALPPMMLSDDLWVLDRGHGTELVLSAVLNRPIPYTMKQFIMLDNMLSLNTIVMFIDVPKDELKRRMQVTGRLPEGPYDKMRMLWSAFLIGTKCEKVMLDGMWPTQHLADRVLNAIDKVKEAR